MNSIEVRGATKSYGSKNNVLNGLNLSVQSGSIYSLIGASGCGKTTLLSCILGMRQLNSGTIKILGENVIYDKTSKLSHIIGYMPQEISLVVELTIKETLNYFGNIYQMNQTLLKQRLVMICELLELNDVNKQVMHYSGGEQRRISFAAALIHDPTILILDEPTVGLDSILREKIWTFLNDLAKSSNKTVIITTHYIAEAEKSNFCGLMRNGTLLAEDSPQNIIQNLEVFNLEEAFYNLCLLKNSKVNYNATNNNENLQIKSSNLVEKFNLNEKLEIVQKGEKIKKFSFQVLKALFDKEMIRVRRQPKEIAFVFLLPIVQTLCFLLAIGRHPMGLKLGIVNFEVTDNNICSEYLKPTNNYFNSTSCSFEKLSCYFLNELEDESATKIYYNSFDEAYKSAKAGEIYGVLIISPNITDVINNTKNDWQLMRNTTDLNLIQIYLDENDYTISLFLHIRLLKAYERFNKKLLRKCNQNDKMENFGIDVETFYGNIESDHVIAMTPSSLTQILFLSGILFSISCISQSRIDGVWNRTMLAGVSTNEVLAVQFFILTISDVIQVVVIKLMVDFAFDKKLVGNMWLLGIICIGIYMIGSSIGLFVSINTKSIYVVNNAGIMIVMSCSFLCGGVWPIEAQPTFLKYISNVLPLTVPAETVRNIIIKGLSFSHFTIYGGFLVIIAYILTFLSLSFLTLRRSKYSN